MEKNSLPNTRITCPNDGYRMHKSMSEFQQTSSKNIFNFEFLIAHTTDGKYELITKRYLDSYNVRVSPCGCVLHNTSTRRALRLRELKAGSGRPGSVATQTKLKPQDWAIKKPKKTQGQISIRFRKISGKKSHFS